MASFDDRRPGQGQPSQQSQHPLPRPEPRPEPQSALSALEAETRADGPAIPAEYVAASDEERVTVCHGYGRVPPSWRNFIDRQLFVGGVARQVPYAWVKRVRLTAPGTILYTFKHDATPADFARVCGLSPEMLDPALQGALLSALQPSEIVDAMGREAVVKLAEDLLAAVGVSPRARRAGAAAAKR